MTKTLRIEVTPAIVLTARNAYDGDNLDYADQIAMHRALTAAFQHPEFVRQIVPEWLPIESAPRERTPMIVVCGVFADRNYVTDPWCVFWQEGKWQRWPHSDPPTHWQPLPEPPRANLAGLLGVGDG